jgi:hypothetical protein
VSSTGAPAARHRAGGAYRCGFVSQPIAPWPAAAIGQAPAAPLYAQQSLSQQFVLHPQQLVHAQQQQPQQAQVQQHWLVRPGQLQGGLNLQRPSTHGASTGAETADV